MTLPTLYVLDDDEQFAKLLSQLAKDSGWETIIANDPVLFLQNNLSETDVLVLDLNMPKMDGIEVIRSIADKNSSLILILVSGYDQRVLHSAQQLAEAHNLKVASIFTKPIAQKKFKDVLAKIKHESGISLTKIQESTVKKSILVSELENAIKNKELVLYYQPQINLKTGKMLGVEALVRWIHPTNGIIFPD